MIDNIVTTLRARGLDAAREDGPSPTSIVVNLGARRGALLIAHDFNVPNGWEAMAERFDSDPWPLEDGPVGETTAEAVADWIEGLSAGMERA